MIPHIALEEIGAPYEIIEVALEPSPPDWYLQLNPHGKVPTAVDRGGADTDKSIVCPPAAIPWDLMLAGWHRLATSHRTQRFGVMER